MVSLTVDQKVLLTVVPSVCVMVVQTASKKVVRTGEMMADQTVDWKDFAKVGPKV